MVDSGGCSEVRRVGQLGGLDGRGWDDRRRDCRRVGW
jgi:hypothetical protein